MLRSTRNGFCVYDSKGVDYDQMEDGLEEISNWLEDGVRHLQPCAGVDHGEERPRFTGPPPRFLKRKVNGVMVVINMEEIYRAQKCGDSRPLLAARSIFRRAAEGRDPVVALTHGDLLAAEERVEARLTICESLGVSESTGAYDIACMNECGLLVDEFDVVTAYSLAEAVYRAILVADRSHLPKRKPVEWVLYGVNRFMWFLSAVFAFISFCFSSLAGRRRCKLKIG